MVRPKNIIHELISIIRNEKEKKINMFKTVIDVVKKIQYIVLLFTPWLHRMTFFLPSSENLFKMLLNLFKNI